MNFDAISESEWTELIQGTREVQFEFLGLQLLIVNLRQRLRAGEISIREGIAELKEFYTKFSRLPSAAKDFNQITHRGQPAANGLMDLEETTRRIVAGESLLLAGEEKLLAALPPGNWIGGTVPCFMSPAGGGTCPDKILVAELPRDLPTDLRTYSAADLAGVYQDAATGTLSFILLPAGSPAHIEFALNAPRYPGFAQQPLVGWVAGQLGPGRAKVFCGGPQPLEDGAAVLRIQLPADRLAQINIINLFQPGAGDTISFPTSGFSATTAFINGQEQDFAEYLQRVQANPHLPLVANYCGAMVNVSLKTTKEWKGRVDFYAPVVAGIEYKLAAPIRDYLSQCEARLQQSAPENVLFSCHCYLNYLHSRLEGTRTGTLVGPVTYGEIAFQLLNQTLVYVELVKVAQPAAGEVTLRELAAAHTELQASERRFRALSESAPIGILLTDAAGHVIYSNSVCKKLSGITPAESGTGAWMRRIHPDDLAGVVTAIQAGQRAGGDFEYEHRFMGRDGRICWVHTRMKALGAETGGITGYIGTVEDVTEQKDAEIEMERVHRELIRASHESGMAEVATGVLHNVKNVINSLNVSASAIAGKLRKSKAAELAKVTALLHDHASDLGTFITTDPKGRLVPGYLELLVKQLAIERAAMLEELQHFETKVQHVKEIVSLQQSDAKRGGATEPANPVDLMEDALRFNAASLSRHGVRVERAYAAGLPEIQVKKHQVLQILVNFIRNAKQACQASSQPDRKLALRVANGDGFVHLAVTDNGIGFAPEIRQRLFQHGFTTKEDGHGFGLHSAVVAARELGGTIEAQSDGPGTGATFTLKLPLAAPAPPTP